MFYYNINIMYIDKFENKRLVLFSPIRTGSTLLYNILKIIFSNYNITKNHKYIYDDNSFYFITIRHPYNSILSSCLRYNLEPTDENFINNINEYVNNGAKDLLKNKFDRKNHIIFIYEYFYNNFDYIYKKIETYFDIIIPNNIKNKINEEFNIISVKKKLLNFKDSKDFTYECKDTLLHGNHISIYNGETNYKNLLTSKRIEKLKDEVILNNIITFYNTIQENQIKRNIIPL